MNIEISDIQFTAEFDYEYTDGKNRTIKAITVTLQLGGYPVFTWTRQAEGLYFLDDEEEERAQDEALEIFARRLRTLVEDVQD